MDILNRYSRLVDQNADRQRQPTKRHQIDRLAGQPQSDDRTADRQRDIQHHHQSAPPIAKEHQDHQADQDRSDGSLAHDAADGSGHERRLIEFKSHIDPFSVGTQSILHSRNRTLDLLDDTQGRSVGTFIRQNINRPSSVDQRVSSRRVGRVADRSDIPDIDRMVTCANRNRRKLLRILDHRVDRHDRIQIADGNIARGTQCVAPRQGRDNLLRGHAIGLQFLRIDRDDNRAGRSTKRRWSRDAWQVREHRTDSEKRQILNLRNAARVTRKDQITDRHTTGIESHDEG